MTALGKQVVCRQTKEAPECALPGPLVSKLVYGLTIRLGNLALQAEGREAEGEKGDRRGFGNRHWVRGP